MKPAAQEVGPVYPWPPHWPYCATVAVAVGAGAEELCGALLAGAELCDALVAGAELAGALEAGFFNEVELIITHYDRSHTYRWSRSGGSAVKRRSWDHVGRLSLSCVCVNVDVDYYQDRSVSV